MMKRETTRTLYDPQWEHDACGVGMLCRIDGEPTHDIVAKGLFTLLELDHRGACGCDEETGDGAGILLQLPHAFFEAEVPHLPAPGDYGAGMIFLPEAHVEQGKQLFEAVAVSEGQSVLHWRRVPTEGSTIGEAARSAEPSMWQCFLGRRSDQSTGALESKLFVIRRLFEKEALSRGWAGTYVASLSTRTIVYKGMLTPSQLGSYFPDLSDTRVRSAVAMVHSRFSTNTFPQWSLAQPFRLLCHNGEINTLRGNINHMRASEALMESPPFGHDLKKLLPIVQEGGSDSMALDNALELLWQTGRSVPHAMMMLVPEAWEHNHTMSDQHRAFYQYHGNLMDPWDGPATLPFTDGRFAGAVLDRNGLRPSRYTITKDGLCVLSSEAGVGGIAEERVMLKERLRPGRMFLVDLEEKRLVSDDEIKDRISARQPYRVWLNEGVIRPTMLPRVPAPPRLTRNKRLRAQQQHGYTLEDLRILMAPMGGKGKEALGSMGNDTALAVLSDHPRLLYDYFKQLFAQVTNPPLDAIREELVTSLALNLGASQNLCGETAAHCAMVRLKQPILTSAALARIKEHGLPNTTISACFKGVDLEGALERLCAEAEAAVQEGSALLVLSDRAAGRNLRPIPALLATAAVHHHLLAQGLRMQCSLIVESAEPREVHHFAMLLGYGAEAVNPFLALETVEQMARDGELGDNSAKRAAENFIAAIGHGLLKVMSKMGISTLQSYQGAQIFEAIGIADSVIEAYFKGTPSRIQGIDLGIIAEEVVVRHRRAYPEKRITGTFPLEVGGIYQWRRGGERHLLTPTAIARMQHAVRENSTSSYEAYSEEVNARTQGGTTLRGLFEFDFSARQSIPLVEVEPWTAIVKRFKSGAMSNGSISNETHEALAVALNAIGGKSNTGEGGESPERYGLEDARRSRIKQVASGRFGVTIGYLTSADEIQIKIAQGAKPGEGGQLPGEKVYPWIAKLRHSTPYVGLISPPPHHDIYSIEDLAQLIHDLKNANPSARISVKLVSEVGVGTVAAGVAKGKADVVLISGMDGGTGASPQTSIMHAGLPWELGLAETHQTLVHHGLRSRIVVECDGQLKTGRDVAIASLLGADEFGFATAPLVALGCIMMRKCHLNTCPVGIATQNPDLRKLFEGTPEHVINYFHFVAEELRGIMASLGFRTLDEMRGQVSALRPRSDVTHWKARTVDLSRILEKPVTPEALKVFAANEQDHGLDVALDHTLIRLARPAIEHGKRVRASLDLRNTHRTVGAMLSHEITKRYGEKGLAEDTIRFTFRGTAGQSFGAFGAPGVTLRVAGDANDYFGKGLSGAKLIIQPPPGATYEPHRNIIVGNVALYGGTRGSVFIRGRAGERFAVRNSGVHAVVEAVGDHGCEYMTGGRVVVLGRTGRNFGAGMSGGVAYVLDGTLDFRSGRCNTESVELLQVESDEDKAELHALVRQHYHNTGSCVALWVLENWETALREFVQVMPTEYRRAIQKLSRPTAQAAA